MIVLRSCPTSGPGAVHAPVSPARLSSLSVLDNIEQQLSAALPGSEEAQRLTDLATALRPSPLSQAELAALNEKAKSLSDAAAMMGNPLRTTRKNVSSAQSAPPTIRETQIGHLSGGQISCAKCGTDFTPSRRDQRYCSRPCQRHASRGSRTVADSPEKSRRMLDLLDALSDLNEAYYQTPPEDRLPQLKRWLDEARSGNRRLASILTCPRFFRLDQTTGEKETICYRRSREYPPVPFLADRFAQRFLDCRGWEWISGQAPEPETGEILACRG